MMRIFLRFEDFTTGLALRLSMAFLVIAASLALYQVLTRFVFGNPSTWSEVITRAAMVWSVFMGTAPAFRYGAMISVDIVQQLLPPRIGLGLYVVANLLSAMFFSVLFWQGWAMTLRVVNQKLAALEVSIAWAYAALPIGAVSTVIAILACILRGVGGEWKSGRTAIEVVQ